MCTKAALAASAIICALAACGGDDGDAGSGAPQPSWEEARGAALTVLGESAPCNGGANDIEGRIDIGEEPRPERLVVLDCGGVSQIQYSEYAKTADVDQTLERLGLSTTFTTPYFRNEQVLVLALVPDEELGRRVAEAIKADCGCGEVQTPGAAAQPPPS